MAKDLEQVEKEKTCTIGLDLQVPKVQVTSLENV